MSQSHLLHLQKSIQSLLEKPAKDSEVKTLNQELSQFSEEFQQQALELKELKERYKQLSIEHGKVSRTLKNKIAEHDAAAIYYTNILNGVTQGVLFIDLEGVITTYNRTAEVILGVPTKDALYQSFWSQFKDGLFGFSMRQALADRKAKNAAFATIKIAGATERRFEIVTSFIDKMHAKNHRSSDNFIHRPQGLFVLIRDVSEIQRLELVASRNDKMKELGEMAALVAHEIRNPLGGIKGFASLLQRDLVDYPELQRLAEYIVEGTDSLNRLVNDILDYTHNVELSFAPVDLVLLMQGLILHLNADESVDPRIELRTHSSKAELIVPVDGASLKLAILNLTSNAIQSMPEGGELLIDVSATDKLAVIKVSDTGNGISKENLERIFSPFFTTRAKGHGLGLSEAQKIIQAHGGQVEVESEFGQGTTFTIKLPLRRKMSKSKSFRQSTEKSNDRYKK